MFLFGDERAAARMHRSLRLVVVGVVLIVMTLGAVAIVRPEVPISFGHASAQK
ncbi:hypothetical protein PV458_31410 [Streptomyces sp. MN03-5084-2B]|nr:hypothetical protein [Streptomyces sp. MN03-5084-2B]